MLYRKTQKVLWNFFKDVITCLRAQDLSVPPKTPTARPFPRRKPADEVGDLSIIIIN